MLEAEGESPATTGGFDPQPYTKHINMVYRPKCVSIRIRDASSGRPHLKNVTLRDAAADEDSLQSKNTYTHIPLTISLGNICTLCRGLKRLSSEVRHHTLSCGLEGVFKESAGFRGSLLQGGCSFSKANERGAMARRYTYQSDLPLEIQKSIRAESCPR